MTKSYCDICGKSANNIINSMQLDICPECLNHLKRLINTNAYGFVMDHKHELEAWSKELNLSISEVPEYIDY